ncbi:hypothetical protein E2C01_046756 [Portunus trituberculatus]|uniref:Uncharacterized protein n=1 Tax=Portunus trituberculatus TaxID=210409 RepID=A0A5B7G5L0_PORTR|nr:hypothetical protein [Portunus trituberculatus]
MKKENLIEQNNYATQEGLRNIVVHQQKIVNYYKRWM